MVEDKMPDPAPYVPPGGGSGGPATDPLVTQSIIDLCDILLAYVHAMPAAQAGSPHAGSVDALQTIKQRFLVRETP